MLVSSKYLLMWRWWITFFILMISFSGLGIGQENVYKLKSSPAIDGVLDPVWESRSWIPIEKTFYYPKPLNNFSGKFKTGWKSDSLFIYFDIKDDSIIKGDMIIIYLDLGLEKKEYIKADDENDFAIMFFVDEGIIKVSRPVFRYLSFPYEKSINAGQRIEKSKGFYIVEIAIPLSVLGFYNTSQTVDFALNVEIIDVDKENSVETSLFWNIDNSLKPLLPNILSCTYHYKSMVLSDDDNPLLISYKKTDIKSLGKYTGSIDITVSNGVPPYSYSWSNGSESEDIFKLDSGKYSITVKDNEGRTAFETIEIFDYRPNVIAVCKHTSVAPVLDGYIDNLWNITNYNPVKNSNNQVSAKFKTLWYNGIFYFLIEITDSTIFETKDKLKLYFDWGNERMPGELDKNDYCLVFNLNNSDSVNSLKYNNIISNSKKDLPDFRNVQSIDRKNGLYILEMAFDYEKWSSLPKTTPDLQIGFELKIEDYNGKNSTEIVWNKADSSNIIDPALWGGITFFESLTVKADISDVSKNGGSDGKIDITVIGGQEPYTFLWGTGDTTRNLSGLTAGEYLLTVTDNYGISASFILIVGINGPLQKACSIRGTIFAGNIQESKACVLLYLLKDKYYEPVSYCISGDSGSYFFENLVPGEYLIYAIPEKNNKKYLPTYYVNSLTWETSHAIYVKGKAVNVDIFLLKSEDEKVYNGEVSGVVVYSDTLCYEKNMMENIVIENIPINHINIDNPACNIPVFLNCSNKVVAWDISDRNGKFSFNNLKSNKYTVTAQKPSLKIYKSVSVELSENSNIIDDVIVSLGDFKIISYRPGKELDISIFPQPCNKFVNIDFKNFALGDFSVSLYDMNGKLFKKIIYTGKLNSTKVTIDITELPDNLYIGEVTSTNYNGHFRIIKTR